MKCIKPLALLCALVLSVTSLEGQTDKPTRRDTLRGTLSELRSCYDVTHYDLLVRIDTSYQSIWGENTITFRAERDFRVMQVDLFANMVVSKITFQGQTLNLSREYDAINIEFPHDLKAGERYSITIQYFGKPLVAKNPPWDGGFVWETDNRGLPWITVACQGTGASLWWPCKDHLSDEPDSMDIHCQVPPGLMCISNGQDRGISTDKYGKPVFNWHVSYPINNYNVTLNIGDYVHLHDTYTASDGDTLSLDYYVLRESEAQAHTHFQQVKPMLSCYETYLGKYPFWNDGYALVQTPYLGMEHQGAIAYGNRFLSGYLGSDRSGQKLPFDYIIIHETGHEWWGNSVSAADIADMWIHESFCTYSEAIYTECVYGYDTAMTYVNALRGTVQNKTAIMGVYGLNREGHYDMYVKGMLFLNTLRHVIHNDSLWWSLIYEMAGKEFYHRTTNYDEVVAYFNRKSGMNMAPLFDQYVKHHRLPQLEYVTRKKRNKTVTAVRWVADVPDFAMPLTCSIDGEESQVLITSHWKKIHSVSPIAFDQIHYYYSLKKLLRQGSK
jgi:aminopeptidase N